MLRSFIKKVLEFRFLVVILAAALMVFGALQYREIPVDILPEFSQPHVVIQTEALGLSAQEVEQLITLGMEQDLLNGVPWLDSIRSESIDGLSSIVITFKAGTDLNRARQMVAERLVQAFALPHVSKPPTMLQPTSSSGRIMVVGLSSKSLSLIQLSVLARWTIVPRLLGVSGVANVATWGQRDRQLQVQVDPQLLSDQKVSLLQVLETTGNALWVSSLSFLEASTPGTGGFIESPTQRLGIRHILPIVSPEGLSQVPFEEAEGNLGDVATVVEGNQPLIGEGLTRDGSSLLLLIEKFPGANTGAVTNGVEQALEGMRPGLSGVDIDTDVYRATDFIDVSMNNVSSAALIGFMLMALVFAVFFFGWRTLVISLVATSMSLLAGGIILSLRGATINIFMIAGFVIALGVLVDEVISDVNQVAGHPSAGRDMLDTVVAMRGTSFYVVIILLVVITPIFFVEAPEAIFFQSMVVSYGLAIVASAVVALTITPALCLILLGNRSVEQRKPPLARWLVRRYEMLLKGIIERPRPLLVIMVIITLAGLGILPFIKPETGLLFKEPNLLVHLNTVPGTSQPEMSRITGLISQELRGIQGVVSVGAQVGRAVQGDRVVNVNSADLLVRLDSSANYDRITAIIRNTLNGYPGVHYDLQTYLQQVSNTLVGQVDNSVVVRVFGDRIDVLRTEAEHIEQALVGISGIAHTHFNLPIQQPTLQIEVDLATAQHYGLKPGDVRRAVSTLVSGIQVGSLFEEQKVFDVVVWSTPQTRDSLTSINNLLIDTPSGISVRLSDVAKISVIPADSVIRHDAVKRYLDVIVDVEGRDRAAVATDIHNQMQLMQFPLEYYAEVQGDYTDQQAATTHLIILVVAAAIGAFFLLQAAFNSWRLAALSFLTLPATLVGGLLLAVVTGAGLSFGLAGGLLAVFGIALRNQIVLITHYRHLTKDAQGNFDLDMAVRGASERVTAVLMTALAITGFLLPALLMGNIAGLEILRPMAVTILGCLITSTVIALFIMPALYLAAKVPYTEDLDLDIEHHLSGHTAHEAGL